MQVVHDMLPVMEKDALPTSHPISVEVEDPREIHQYFDDIAYEKVFLKAKNFRKTNKNSNNII